MDWVELTGSCRQSMGRHRGTVLAEGAMLGQWQLACALERQIGSSRAASALTSNQVATRIQTAVDAKAHSMPAQQQVTGAGCKR